MTKVADAGLWKRGITYVGHSQITRTAGQVLVRHFGPEHIPPSVTHNIWLQPGETAVIRHIEPEDHNDGRTPVIRPDADSS